MRVKRVSLSVLLPTVFGGLSIILMGWDWIAGFRCMFYDTGRPFWRCEAPGFLLNLINFPVIAGLRLLIERWIYLTRPINYLVELPAIIGWWWFVGSRLDLDRFGAPMCLRPKMRTLGAVALVYVTFVGAIFLHMRRVEARERAAQELRTTMVHGQVVDDRGLPIKGIEVDLVPSSKTGDEQWSQTVREWTNSQGEYLLKPEESGEYILAVLWDGAPDAKHPFMTRYYPDAADEPSAERLDITEARHTELKPMRLHPLSLVKVAVKVEWSDGTPEKNAGLLFRNELFPHQATIGNESVSVAENDSVALPEGFEYNANAAVQCDAGKKIEQRESPRVYFTTLPGKTPKEALEFVLTGSPCKVWHPR